MQDGTYVIAVGNGGSLFSSANQRILWVQAAKLFSVHGTASLECRAVLCMVGESGVVMQSSDHGLTWAQLSLGVTQNFRHFVARNDRVRRRRGRNVSFLFFKRHTLGFTFAWDHGQSDRCGRHRWNSAWIVGANGTLIKTIQNGLSMSQSRSRRETLNAVHFISSDVGFVVGTSGTVLKTTDGGVSWKNFSISGVTDQNLYSIASYGDRVAIAGDRILVVSDDAGATWKSMTFAGSSKVFYKVAYTDALNFLAVGTDASETSLIYQLDVSSDVQTPVTEPVSIDPPSAEAIIGSLVKLSCSASSTADDRCRAVYYYGSDGKRHAFPNERVFATWYSDFDNVVEVSPEFLSSLPLGKNVTYRRRSYGEVTDSQNCLCG